jgi:maltooligosyltrehalose trehalohydrolase
MKGFGAIPTDDGFAFRVWAPGQKQLALVMERPDGSTVHPMGSAPDGTHSATVPGVTAGDRYRYRLDDDRVLPDPASRSQPDGVHGPSALVDPRGFPWTDGAWSGIALEDVVFYELHVGTFSPEGTFAGAAARLPELAALGVTAVELMPVADFPGNRNWGYDGVALFAPARCYGTPDDLRRLVDAAHALGLAVFLDVVYNHFGPDGAYAAAFSPYFFTDRHRTPWGAAMNFDGEGSATARAFFLDNARHWITEYHFDGLRLDATHAIVDDGPRHFLAELTAHVRGAVQGRRVLVVAEDHRNLSWMLKPESERGWGLDAVWADAFHHQCRRLLAGDSEGYYRDYSGRTEDLATTIRRGWFYIGQQSIHLGEPRGTDPAGIPNDRFVICAQNHDQIGNRALGTRLHHEIDAAAYRAVSTLLLTAPETPLLFMGQEWAASTPFLFFTDHNPELGRLVTEGRREEFKHFAAFSDPAARDRIPDPQAESTFLASRLRWDERAAGPHASTLRLYRALLELRRREPALRRAANFTVGAPDEGTIALQRDPFQIVVRLQGHGAVPLPPGSWTCLLTTEDGAFCQDPQPVEISEGIVCFKRPGGVVLHSAP